MTNPEPAVQCLVIPARTAYQTNEDLQIPYRAPEQGGLILIQSDGDIQMERELTGDEGERKIPLSPLG